MTFLFILAVTALVYTAIQNRKLAVQIAALNDRQTETETRIDSLSRKSKKTTCKQRAFDRKIEQQRKRQARLAKAQEQIRKEQTKQGENIRKMEYKLSAALSDIQHQQTRITQLYALLDVAMHNQAGTYPGTAQDVRYQKEIIAIENQIASAEKKLAKAQFDAAEAREKIAA